MPATSAQQKAEKKNDAALKHLFGRALLKRIADAITAVYPKFDRKKFQGLEPRLTPLEMKPRIHVIRDALKALLPADYEKSLAILLKSTRAGKLEGFDIWPYAEFVQTYGLGDPARSLDALRSLTTPFYIGVGGACFSEASSGADVGLSRALRPRSRRAGTALGLGRHPAPGCPGASGYKSPCAIRRPRFRFSSACALIRRFL